MKIIKFLDDHIEEILLVIILGAMAIITFAQVVMRYFFSPLSWSEEMARFLFIWLSYIGLSYGVKRSAHIKIDVLLSVFPKFSRRYILMLADIIFIAFSIFIVITAYQNSMEILRLGQRSPAMGVQMGYIYLGPVLGFGLTTIRLIQNFLSKIRNPQAAEEEKTEVII